MIYTKRYGIHQWFVTKDCAYPELAFKIGDLGFDPYTQLCSRHGFEGVTGLKILKNSRAFTLPLLMANALKPNGT